MYSALQEEWRKFCSSTQEFDANFDIDPRKPIQEALNRTLAVLRQVGPWAAWKVWSRKSILELYGPYSRERVSGVPNVGEGAAQADQADVSAAKDRGFLDYGRDLYDDGAEAAGA